MKRKGFTLIELLAVIVILAVVALIAVPQILGVMKSARRSSFKSSASGIVESTKDYYSKQVGNYTFNGETFIFLNNKPKELEYDGKNPTKGQVTVKENGDIELYITDGEFCAYKAFDNTEIIITDVTETGCGGDVEVPTISVAGKKITSNTLSLEALCTLKDNSKVSVIKYEFSKDGKTWNSKIVNGEYLNHYTYSDLNQNNKYTFKARCITDAGTSAEKTTNILLKEITKPIINVPSGWAREKTVTIDFPKGRYKYQISEDEGKTWINVDAKSGNTYNTYTKTYQKNLTLLARVLDESGNYVDSNSTKITGIDRTPPICGTFTGNNSWTRNNVTVKLSCSDTESGCTASSYNAKTYSSGTIKTASLSYTIKDNAGNTTNCSGSANIYLDKEGPSKPSIAIAYGQGGATIGTYSSGSWTKYDILTDIGSSDTGSGIAYYQYSHDNANWSNDISKLGWSNSYYNGKNELQYWITWEGNWNFYIRAVDNLGNVSASSNVFTLRIDKTAPTANMEISGPKGTVLKSLETDGSIEAYLYVDIKGNSSDGGGSGVRSSNISCIGTNITLSQNRVTYNSTSGSSDASCTITVTDNAGNTNSSTSTFTVGNGWQQFPDDNWKYLYRGNPLSGGIYNLKWSKTIRGIMTETNLDYYFNADGWMQTGLQDNRMYVFDADKFYDLPKGSLFAPNIVKEIESLKSVFEGKNCYIVRYNNLYYSINGDGSVGGSYSNQINSWNQCLRINF